MHMPHRKAVKRWSGKVLCALCVALLLLAALHGDTTEQPASVTADASLRQGAFGLPRGGHGSVDVNHADLEELTALHGIGETLAGAILEERERSPFYFPEDLLNVKGIGTSKLEAIREWICFE